MLDTVFARMVFVTPLEYLTWSFVRDVGKWGTIGLVSSTAHPWREGYIWIGTAECCRIVQAWLLNWILNFNCSPFFAPPRQAGIRGESFKVFQSHGHTVLKQAPNLSSYQQFHRFVETPFLVNIESNTSRRSVVSVLPISYQYSQTSIHTLSYITSYKWSPTLPLNFIITTVLLRLLHGAKAIARIAKHVPNQLPPSHRLCHKSRSYR